MAQSFVSQVINLLSLVYASVADIDLYIGGVTELHVRGALLGPTFSYIISQQFANLKRADRFFYSYLNQPVSFNASKYISFKIV